MMTFLMYNCICLHNSRSKQHVKFKHSTTALTGWLAWPRSISLMYSLNHLQPCTYIMNSHWPYPTDKCHISRRSRNYCKYVVANDPDILVSAEQNYRSTSILEYLLQESRSWELTSSVEEVRRTRGITWVSQIGTTTSAQRGEDWVRGPVHF